MIAMVVCLVSATIVGSIFSGLAFTSSANALPPRHVGVTRIGTARPGPLVGANWRRARRPPPNVGAIVATSRRMIGTTDFQVGYDYTQNSHLPADAGGNAASVASAKFLLSSMDTFQNVALMGWGAGDPEPSPGSYAWGTLDSLVDAMADTVGAGQRMITLCTAPGWMKVGGGSQEWNMEAAVSPSHFQDFANLAASVAVRYDGSHRTASGELLPRVDYFDVWNEMKGFWNSSANTWDYQNYTVMYNDVYRAIKAVRPDAQVGGPYAPVGAGTSAATIVPSAVQGAFGVVDQRALDVLTYWLQYKAGAQFVSMDGGPGITNESPFTSGQYFAAVSSWLRTLNPTAFPGANSLPIVWAEFYPGLDSTAGLATGEQAVAIDLTNIIEAGEAGINYMMLWEMEGTTTGVNPLTGESVWTDTASPVGGKPTGLYLALRDLRVVVSPPGMPIYDTRAFGPVAAIATRKGVLVVSESAGPLTVLVGHTTIRLAPYQFAVVRHR